MADRTFWYGRVDPGYGRYRYELKLPGRIDLSDEHDLQDLAELAADDYFGNHDGWEASWPIMFAIASTEDGPELARFRVELESQPVFNAMRIAGVAPTFPRNVPMDPQAMRERAAGVRASDAPAGAAQRCATDSDCQWHPWCRSGKCWKALGAGQPAAGNAGVSASESQVQESKS